MELLLTAYQEELLSLDELRVRMPPLRQREQAMQANFKRSITKQRIARRIYSLPKPSQRFWNACAPMLIPSIWVNANEL